MKENYLDRERDSDYIEPIGPMMVVSCRSQMKSLKKNIDTIYERLIQEPGDIHGRYPHLPYGMLHMLPAEEIEEVNNSKRTKSYNLEQHLNFDSSEIGRDEYISPIDRPEAFNLLIVDFESGPVILDTTQQLLDRNMISDRFAERKGEWIEDNLLSTESFFESLVSCFDERYSLVSDYMRS